MCSLSLSSPSQFHKQGCTWPFLMTPPHSTPTLPMCEAGFLAHSLSFSPLFHFYLKNFWVTFALVSATQRTLKHPQEHRKSILLLCCFPCGTGPGLSLTANALSTAVGPWGLTHLLLCADRLDRVVLGGIAPRLPCFMRTGQLWQAHLDPFMWSYSRLTLTLTGWLIHSCCGGRGLILWGCP